MAVSTALRQVVTCSGAYADGSLRVVRNGVGLNEHARVEMPGVKEMWALHLIPLGIMAITTGLLVKGKALSQIAMTASGTIVVVIGGGMGFMTQRHDYGTSGGAATLVPLIVMLLVILLGVAGYMHKDDPEESGE